MRVATSAAAVPMAVAANAAVLGMALGAAYQMTAVPEYHGAMEVTPSDQTQTLETDGRLVNGNIVINPIPNNYGLITWDGSTITVS